MRKDKQQRKKTKEQLDLFRGTIEPVGTTIGRTDGNFQSGVELSSRLEKQRTLTANLLTKIVDYENLNRAYKQVKRNDGSSGVDKMEIEDFGQWLKENLNNLRTSILTEQYEVSAVRKVEIPKPSGGTRMLGIPTVKDRFIQQAIHQELNRFYDPHFSEHSYGFRPGKDAHQAILRATQYIKDGKEWVVDIDLEKFFDKINHDRLMQRLSKGIGDKKLLRLINAYLKAGMMEGGVLEQRTAGTPQGGPLALRTHSQTLSFREGLKLKEGSFNYIIKSIIFMINGTITEFRAGQTDQSYVHTVATGNSPATNSGQVDTEVWDISDTGLSLYKPCKRDQRENGDTGKLCGVYRQITTQTDQAHQEVIRNSRPDDQQSGTYCAGRIFSKAGSCQKRRSKLKYPLPMTVCGSINSRKCITPLFRAASQLFSQKKIVMN